MCGSGLAHAVTDNCVDPEAMRLKPLGIGDRKRREHGLHDVDAVGQIAVCSGIKADLLQQRSSGFRTDRGVRALEHLAETGSHASSSRAMPVHWPP